MHFASQPFRYCLPSVIWIAVLVAGTEAFASCGDYLHQPEHDSMQAETNDVESTPSAASFRGAFRIPLPVPCNGPGCRNAPIDPTETAPPALPQRVDSHSALQGSGHPSARWPGEPRRHIRAADDRRAGHNRRIDRPPQPNA